jgi:hypothetical protein
MSGWRAAASACCVACLAEGTGQEPDFQPWGGAAVGDWSRAAEATILTDLSPATPAAALSPMQLRKGCWKVIPYEMVGGLAGNMVFAPPEAKAPELALPLNVKETAWYALFVGLFSTAEVPTLARLRLDTDPAPVLRANQRNDFYGNSEEVFFKVARLTPGSHLCLSQQSTGMVSGCGVTHVKLIPLSPAEVQRLEADRADASHRTLIATNDGFSSIFGYSPRSAAALLTQVELFRDTDFGTLILHSPGADKVNYPTQVGHMKGTHAEEYPRVGDRYFVEAIKELATQQINPMKTLIDGVHAMGMKAHVAIRPAGWSFFEPYSDYWESPFYREHPEWRCMDRDGTPVARLSWAVPEVRRHMIELLREQVRFGADGAHVAFVRGYPVVLYEAPALELFRQRFDADPRQVPESDPRITQWWSDIVLTFMRELRTMLDEEQRARGDGKRLELSMMVLGTAQDDLRFGVDIRQLVEAGLIDAVSTELGFGRSGNTYNLPLLREVCRPRGVPFSPGMSLAPVWYASIPAYYDAGATGLALWDPEGVTDIFHWTWVSRFGHADETRWRLANLKLENAPRTVLQFHKLGDQIRDGRFGPYWGG